jgi:hypothetical protein
LKLFRKAADGGENSGVTGFFLIECKSLFSVVLLRFNAGTREAYHEHAFNALTVWLYGAVKEHHWGKPWSEKVFGSGDVKYTSRHTFHKIEALETTWALSFRGPWVDRWQESRNGKRVTLTHGRKEIE